MLWVMVETWVDRVVRFGPWRISVRKTKRAKRFENPGRARRDWNVSGRTSMTPRRFWSSSVARRPSMSGSKAPSLRYTQKGSDAGTNTAGRVRRRSRGCRRAVKLSLRSRSWRCQSQRRACGAEIGRRRTGRGSRHTTRARRRVGRGQCRAGQPWPWRARRCAHGCSEAGGGCASAGYCRRCGGGGLWSSQDARGFHPRMTVSSPLVLQAAY